MTPPPPFSDGECRPLLESGGGDSGRAEEVSCCFCCGALCLCAAEVGGCEGDIGCRRDVHVCGGSVVEGKRVLPRCVCVV